MIIRRIIAGFFVFLLVIVSIPTFFIHSISQTILNPSFYEGPFVDNTYQTVIEIVSENIYKQDKTLQKHFQKDEINSIIKNVFTIDLYREIMKDFGVQIEQLKLRPEEPVTFSLKTFRESLLTASHNLAFEIFQKIPSCEGNQLPEVNQEGIPTCIPKDLKYTDVAGPLSRQFEKTVYNTIQEQIQIDLNTTDNSGNEVLIYIFSSMEEIKTYLLGTMLLILAIIAFIIYQPISVMIYYESIAFILSGLAGFILSLIINAIPRITSTASPDLISIFGSEEKFREFTEKLIKLFTNEIQNLALVFLVLGAIMLVMNFALKINKSNYVS